ncbi:hypothetical protein BT93_A1357 [Corymbia citriodora subsp. variegata]|nr:hypothetical protein BT93_A1357 [Corymbia citriodora subsp. variegata]
MLPHFIRKCGEKQDNTNKSNDYPQHRPKSALIYPISKGYTRGKHENETHMSYPIPIARMLLISWCNSRFRRRYFLTMALSFLLILTMDFCHYSVDVARQTRGYIIDRILTTNSL